VKLSLPQLVELARGHGFPNPELAASVAMAESGGDAAAVHDSRAQVVFPPGVGPELSIGLWQVNVQPNANPQYAAWDLTNPDANATAAFQISSGGRVWKPWSTFNSGAYRQYYREVRPLGPNAKRVAPVLAVTVVAGLATIAGYAALQRRRFA